jgi:hypothetical protein
MSELIAHDCPKEDYDEVWVSAGKFCPNGCGWWATDGDAELYAVAQAQAALEQWGPWLRLHEAADQSGIPFPTIAQAAREGRLPTLQLGRQKFVRLAAVLGRIGLHEKRGRPEGGGRHRSHMLIERRRRLALDILRDSGELPIRKLADEIKRRMPNAFEESGDGISDAMLRDLQYLRDELAAVAYNPAHQTWNIPKKSHKRKS